MKSKSTGEHLVSSVRWSLAAELASRLGLPVVLLALAQLLTPDDFGVVTAAAMVITLSELVWEAGMGKALVQRRTGVEEAATLAFWINIGLAAAVSLLLLAGAGAIATLVFGDERVADVLRVMTLSVFLGAAAAVPTALLQKAMMFRRLFWISLATSLFPVLAALPMAWAGLGYWSLVVGGVAGQALWTLAVWRAVQWRPGRQMARGMAAELARFGGWASVSALLAWGFFWADSLMVGVFLGSHELGVYRTGSQLVFTLFGALFTPVMPVLYSRFSALQANPEQLRAACSRAVRVIGLVAIPVSFALAAVSGAVEIALFNERWEGIGRVIAAISLAQGFAWLVGVNAEAYRAIAKPHFETAAMLLGFAVYLPVYVLFARAGLTEFLWARFAVTFWGIAVQLYFVRRAIDLDIAELLRFAGLLVLASCPILALAFVDWTSSFARIALQGLPPVVLFVAAIWVFVRRIAAEEFRLVLSIAKPRT
jgi:PST family polysaccharide transporter